MIGTLATGVRLLHDGALELIVEPELESAVRPWLPAPPRARAVHGERHAWIQVGRDLPERPPRLNGHTLTAGRVIVWVDASAGTAYMESNAADCAGLVDLAGRTAILGADPAAPGLAATMSMMLAVTSALLVGRLGRAMIHAGAVVDPLSGAAWLLIGDSRAGKSSTTATLVSAGWKYLSDDSITVFSDDEHGLAVDGWVQPFHLDSGWEEGVPTGYRRSMQLETFGEQAWQPTARIAGVFFPRVDADAPSVANLVSPADALSRIIRQSPWVMADSIVAPTTLLLLTALAQCRCAELRLGRDSFGKPERLAACVRTVTG